MKNFQINEKHLSQLPAVELLVRLGYEFISPVAALKERQDRRSNVLLEDILRSNSVKKISSRLFRN